MPDSPHSRAFEVLATPPPALRHDEAEQIAAEHFGVQGIATPLAAERDQNFQVVSADGGKFVLKFSNPLEPLEVTRFQTTALSHIATDSPALPVPRVCCTLDGKTDVQVGVGGEETCTARLFTYLNGAPLDSPKMKGHGSTPQLRVELGRFLAKLDLALNNFNHPGANEELPWNLAHAHTLESLLPYVKAPQRRTLLAHHLEHFRKTVLPSLSQLRWQVIYNDLNASNVLVDPIQPERITGLVDFGDLARAPLIADVAVAATYQLRHTGEPLEAAAQLLSGYHQVTQLKAAEVDVLFDLIVTRLVIALLITTWRATLYPANRDYILRNTSSNWDVLQHLDSLSPQVARIRFRGACGLPKPLSS